MINTVAGQPFRVWVDEQISKRNLKLVSEKNMNIEMDPEIAMIFNASNSVSGKCTFQEF